MLKRIISATLGIVISLIFVAIMPINEFAELSGTPLSADAADLENMTGNFNRCTLTGNPANDIALIAEAQLNRTQSSMGYNYAWCASFVSDCARIINETVAIPAEAWVPTLYEKIINAGGTVVHSPQRGDIIFYWCSSCNRYKHVGIMQSATSSIEGNYSGKVTGNVKYYSDGTHSTNDYITRVYVRPNYSVDSSDAPPATNNYPEYSVTVSDGVNVRSGPGTSYSVLGASPYGTRFFVEKVSDDGNWGYSSSVSTITGIKSGWVHLGYCTRIGSATHTHSYTSSVTSQATCTGTGIMTYTCTCGDSYTETIAKKEHSFSSEFTTDISATCTANGSKSRHCTNGTCSATTDVTEIPATGHSYSSTTTPPACENDGATTYSCVNCGHSYTENIPSTGHSYTTAVISPTYWAQGYTIHDCINCDYSYTEQYRDKLILAPIDLFDVESDSITTDGANLVVVGSTDSTGFIIQQMIDGVWKNIANLKAEYGFASYKVSGLKANTKYTFRAVAYVNENGLNAYSKYTAALSFSTEMKTPVAIQNFKAASKTADSITLSWTKNSTASGYIIQQMKNGVWTNIANIKNNATTSYKVSGLTANTSYQFRAVAYITSGGKTAYSKYTSALSVTTASIPKPAKITGLRVTANASNSISLSWNKVNASGYIIQALKNNVWVNVANIKDNATTSHNVTGLYQNSTYRFRIVAYNKAGTTTVYGTYSSAVAGRTAPAKVANLRMTNRGTDFISVRWDKNADADGYMVYIYDGTSWKCVKTLTSASAVSHKITGLKSGKAYKVTVKAYKMVNGTKYISDTATISASTL